MIEPAHLLTRQILAEFVEIQLRRTRQLLAKHGYPLEFTVDPFRSCLSGESRRRLSSR